MNNSKELAKRVLLALVLTTSGVSTVYATDINEEPAAVQPAAQQDGDADYGLWGLLGLLGLLGLAGLRKGSKGSDHNVVVDGTRK